MKKLKKTRIFAFLAVLWLLLTLSVPALALDDDEYGGYAADTLTIKVGYFGGPYYEKRVFTPEELWSMDVVYQDYTFIDNMPSVVIDHVAGVRLADLMDAAGIDLNSIETFYFWTRDKQSDYYSSYPKSALIDLPRYCYWSLPDNWDEDAERGNEYATGDGVPVDTVIALADDWSRCIAGATFGSDYLDLNTNTRYRLIFGQTNGYERTANRSAKWIHEITVELGGAPILTLDVQSLEGKVGSVLRTAASVGADSAVLANEAVTWTSSDEHIATVDENGNITLHAEGTAVITATFAGVTAEVIVTGIEGEGGSISEVMPSGSGDTPGTAQPAAESEQPPQAEPPQEMQPQEQLPQEVQPPVEAPPEVRKAPTVRYYEVQTAMVRSQSNMGGVQNWRTQEMDADSELGNIERDASVLAAVGGSALALLMLSGGAYAALFYRNIGRRKNANDKSNTL